jgi:hypothetical protein
VGKGPYSEAAAYALGLFAEAITDDTTRRRFADDFNATLKEVLEAGGARVQELPQGVRTFLRGLSFQQLGVLAELQKEMVKAGLYDTFAEPARATRDAHHGIATLAKL